VFFQFVWIFFPCLCIILCFFHDVFLKIGLLFLFSVFLFFKKIQFLWLLKKKNHIYLFL
jgi:hypothetical protein